MTKKFLWDESISVGDEKIDDDHKELFAITNTLLDAINTEKSEEVFLSIFTRLDNYVKHHFQREERLMQKYHYPKLDAHIALHREFEAQLPKVKEKFLSSYSKEAALQIYQFLTDWLIQHIIKEDLQYARYIHTHHAKEKESLLQLIIQRLTIRKKLFFLTFVPIVVISILLINTFLDTYHQYMLYQNITHNSDHFVKMNRLTNALQLERGLSVAYTLGDGQKIKQTLLRQRQKVDRLYQAYLHDIQIPNTPQTSIVFKQRLEHAYQKIRQCRQALTKQSCSAHTIINTYTPVITMLLEHQEDTITHHIADAHLHTALKALSALLQQKEQMALKRAVGTLLITHPNDPDAIERFIALNVKELFYQKLFLQRSDTKEKTIFLSLMLTPPFQQSKHYTQTLIGELLRDKKITIDPDIWFQTTTETIEKLKEFINTEIYALQQYSKHNIYTINTHSILWLITLLLLSFFFIYFIFLIEKGIFTPIQTFSNLLISLSKGKRTPFFSKHHTTDEFSLLGDAYEALRIELLKSDKLQYNIDLQEAKTQTLQNLAYIDTLTGVYNRRKLIEIGNYEYRRSIHHHHPLSLLMLDIDHFKKINDTYGHDNGDIALKRLVSLCKQILGEFDRLFRYGGEEFVLLLPETPIEEAMKKAEAIRKLIGSSPIQLREMPHPITITISIGVATLHHKEDKDLDDLMKRADQALYRAKALGRNRVCQADDHTTTQR